MHKAIVAGVTACLLLAGCMTPASTDPAPSANPFTTTDVFAGNYELDDGEARALREPIATLAQPVITRITSEVDGLELGLATYLPEGMPGPFPVVLIVTPYLPEMTPDALAADTYETSWTETFVPHGYAVVLANMRGTSDAAGCLDLMGPLERSDTHQIVDWVSTQPWSTGAVAMTGLSYPGSTPWMAAATGHPALKTIIPIAGLTDIELLTGPNGSQSHFASAFTFYNTPLGMTDNEVERTACQPVLDGIVTMATASTRAESIAARGYWDARNSKPGVEANYEGSIFIIQGLQDIRVTPRMVHPWMEALEQKGLRVKAMFGQWDHDYPDRRYADEGATSRDDWVEIMLRWLDSELLGLDVDVGPRIQVQDGLGNWRSESDWPPHDATNTNLYLGGGEILVSAPSDAPSASYQSIPELYNVQNVTFGTGNAPPETCSMCPRFATQSLESPLRIAGSPRLHVTVTPQGDGGQISAHLYDVNPQGNGRYVGGAQMNLAYAAGDGQRREVMPGQALLARMQFDPIDDVIVAGNQLQVFLFQGQFGEQSARINNHPVTFEVGGDSSTLSFETYVRDESDYFTAPTATDGL